MTPPHSPRPPGGSHTYEIRAQDGTLEALHVRVDFPTGEKACFWRQPNGTSGLGGRAVITLPFYGSEQLADLKPGDLVFVTEGEKAADAVRAHGLTVVGTVTGAGEGSKPPDDAVLATLKDFTVAAWPDADDGGRQHMDQILTGLLRLRGSSPALLRVDTDALGLTEKGADAADWQPEGNPVDELMAVLVPWVPPAPEVPPPSPPDGPADPVPRQRQIITEGKTRPGLLKAFAWLGIDLRYNERSARLELLDLAADPQTWRETDDLSRAAVRDLIAEQCEVWTNGKVVPMAISSRHFQDLIDAILDTRRVDPFKEWINALPPWDKEARLDLWFYGCFKISEIDSDLLKWACRSVPMAAVWRAEHPGEKHDEMVILVGPQGLGKSTTWAWLLPPEHRAKWFSDGLKFYADPKVQVESLQGRVIVEASEMSGVTRAEVENIKAFLSRCNDGSVRLTYRRDPVQLLRRCVIVGSTNDPRCLPNDPSGNRRFVPVPVSGGNATTTKAFMEEHREQLWAEALYRVRVNKETAYLSDELKAAQAELTEQFRAVDEVAEDVIGRCLQDHSGEVTVEQIAKEIQWPADNRNVHRVTTVLKQLGYTRVQRRTDQGRKWFWKPPEA